MTNYTREATVSLPVDAHGFKGTFDSLYFVSKKLAVWMFILSRVVA
jgi:hypothetical protein